MAESEHNVTININGNANVAIQALNRVRSSLGKIGSAISLVSGALGKLNWAIHGIQMVVQAFNWLKDKITETAREMAKMRWDFQMRTAANETARLVGFHEKLSKLLKDELDTLAKQRAVADIEAQGKKDAEDGKREADRARQIFEAKTPEEEQALRDRFAAEDEQREREERKESRKRTIRQLDKEETQYTANAEGLRQNNTRIEGQIAAEEFNLKRANGNKEETEAIQKRIEALNKRKKANEAEIEQCEKEAKFRRDQIAALENQKDYDGPTAGEWQRKTEAKKRAEEAAKSEQEAKDKVEKENRADAERFAEAQRKEKIADAQGRIGDLESFAAQAASFDGVSQNRLTAMGLGSGVSATGGVASDVKTLVKLLEKEIEATKANKPAESSSAVYGA